MQYLISVERDGGSLRLLLSGEIDLAAEECVRSAIHDAVTSDAADVVVDLDGVTFLDCRGISAIVHGRQLADAHGRTYEICNAHGMPLTLLRLAGIVLPPMRAA